MRRIPDIGALRELRRPVISLIAGAVLVAPAVGIRFSGAGEHIAAERAALASKVAAAKTAEGPIERAWKARVLERENRTLAATYASHFDIPLDLAAKIHRIAVEEDITPRLAFGLVRTESAFDRKAVSHVGAIGLAQLMPRTAAWLKPGISRSEIFEEETNLRLGMRYLNDLIVKYDGNVRLALTAYNRGPGTVDRLLRRGRNPENGYATKVLNPRPGRRI